LRGYVIVAVVVVQICVELLLINENHRDKIDVHFGAALARTLGIPNRCHVQQHIGVRGLLWLLTRCKGELGERIARCTVMIGIITTFIIESYPEILLAVGVIQRDLGVIR